MSRTNSFTTSLLRSKPRTSLIKSLILSMLARRCITAIASAYFCLSPSKSSRWNKKRSLIENAEVMSSDVGFLGAIGGSAFTMGYDSATGLGVGSGSTTVFSTGSCTFVADGATGVGATGDCSVGGTKVGGRGSD